MRSKNKNNYLHVYDCNVKSSKGLIESSLDSKIKNHWLNLPLNFQIKVSYNTIIQAFLTPTKSFLPDIIASKWYDMVLYFIKSSFEVSEKLISNDIVLIK